MENKSKRIKSLFITYFDGCYNVDSEPETYSTISMGVCKLDFNEETNTLTVYLRRPGLLIGKGGKTIGEVSEYLDCNIEIKEVDLLN